MGVNLRSLTNMLGLTHTPSYGLSNTNPGSMPGSAGGSLDPSALLGQPSSGGELPPVGQSAAAVAPVSPAPDPTADSGTKDITVNHVRAVPMTPQDLGMPGLAAMKPPAQEDMDAIRQGLKDKAAMARDIYHHGSEFGTGGILRDVIGNVEDFGRRLLGFAPRYNDEKWAERAYGMTSTDPQVAAAATEQAMQYSPQKTMEYTKQIQAEQAQKISSQATAGYRDAQAAAKNSQLLTGIGVGLQKLGQNNDLSVVDAQYQRSRPAIQNMLDETYGKGVMQAPDKYDPAFVDSLVHSGYSANVYQRENANALDNKTRLEVANGRNLTTIEAAQIGADARRYAADQVYRAAVNRAVIAGQPLETTETTSQSGSIIQPTVTKHKTIVRSAPIIGGGAAPASAPQGKQVVRTGMMNGRKVVQYSDGSLDYAD